MAPALYSRQLLGCVWEDDASLLSKCVLCILEDVSEWLLRENWAGQNFPPKKLPSYPGLGVSSITATPKWKRPGSKWSLPHTHFFTHSTYIFLLFLSLTSNATAQAFKEITLTGQLSFYPTTTDTWDWGQEWAKVTVLLMNILLLWEYHFSVSSRPSQNYVQIMHSRSESSGNPKTRLPWVPKTLLVMNLVLFPVSTGTFFLVKCFEGKANRFQCLHALIHTPYTRTVLNLPRNDWMQPRPVR